MGSQDRRRQREKRDKRDHRTHPGPHRMDQQQRQKGTKRKATKPTTHYNERTRQARDSRTGNTKQKKQKNVVVQCDTRVLRINKKHTRHWDLWRILPMCTVYNSLSLWQGGNVMNTQQDVGTQLTSVPVIQWGASCTFVFFLFNVAGQSVPLVPERAALHTCTGGAVLYNTRMCTCT